MFRVILLLFCFAFMPMLMMGAPNANLDIAIERVDLLFSNFKAIADNAAEAADARLSLLDDAEDPFFANLRMRAPGDLAALGLYAADKYDINVENYVNRYYNVSKSVNFMSIDFSYVVDRQRSHILEETKGPEFRKGEMEANYAKVFVDKNLRSADKSLNVTDTVLVNIKSRKIISWTNRTCISHSGTEEVIESVDNLKIRAGLAYFNRDFETAYRLYQKILAKSPKEQEASYKLAIMIYKKQGVPKMSKKKREDRILELLDTAISGRNYSISTCARNMKYWLTC